LGTKARPKSFRVILDRRQDLPGPIVAGLKPQDRLEMRRRFAGPAGGIVAAATFTAYILARAHGLPLVQQRTSATLVTLTVSLCVLVLLALPLTWRRLLLVGSVIGGFALLFPVPGLRRFYALEVPASGLWITMLIAALGVAALAGFWVLSRRRASVARE